MGKGKGKLNSIELNLKPGMILFELVSFSSKLSLKSCRKSIKTLLGDFKILKK